MTEKFSIHTQAEKRAVELATKKLTEKYIKRNNLKVIDIEKTTDGFYSVYFQSPDENTHIVSVRVY